MSFIKRRQIVQGLGGAIAVLTLSRITRSPWNIQAIAQAPPRKLALLIGINQYTAPLAPLRGCVNDVEIQARLLCDRYGFLPQDILILTDENATREGIVTAINEHLVQQAQPGDVVVLHFSGHATVMPYPACDSAEDCSMGVLMPTNSSLQTRQSQGNTTNSEIDNGITRADLEALLSPLATEKLTVVLDTDSAVSFARSDSFVKGVLLAGAMANQSAAEINFEGMTVGAFTYSLTQYLWQQSGDISIAEVMDRVAEATRLQSESSRLLQTPTWIAQPEGNLGQQPVYFVVPTASPRDGNR